MRRTLVTFSLAMLLAPAASARPPEVPQGPTASREERDEARPKRGGGDSGKRSSGKRGPSAPAGGPSARPANGSGGAQRAPAQPQQPASGGAQRAPSQPQQGQPADRDQPQQGQPDRGQPQQGQPDRGQPQQGQPARTPAAERAPGGPQAPAGAVQGRPAEGRAPAARPAAPANYREAARQPAQGGHQQAHGAQGGRGHQQAHSAQAERAAAQARASATARSHAAAARAHAHGNAHAAAHRAAAAAHHRAWQARHHRPWYRRPAVVVWRPGYPHYWYHGVFVYGPAPWYEAPRGAPPAAAAPRREVDRAKHWSIGARAGSYMSGYQSGEAYGDFGMGLAVRYRPVETLGFEGQWTYHDQTWDDSTERIHNPLSLSAQLFAFPWTRFNPYLVAGVTHTSVNLQDDVGGRFVDVDQGLWGPHLGVGLEFGVGENASINFDVRGVGYLNPPSDALVGRGATQGNLGVNFYF